MFDNNHITHDGATVEFDNSVDGITTDDDGDTIFDWDDVGRVRITDPPHTEAFDSKEFFKLPATVARPIPQPYQYGNDSVWLKKPREELKKAAWSLDNAPWVLGHPSEGMVKDVNDVKGFWKNPRYIDALDDLDADLHVPVDDEEAREYVENNTDVSVGFYNRIARIDEYDGVIGGSDDEEQDIDGYQTNMMFDHVASVKVGRCPESEGCGIDRPKNTNVGVFDSETLKRDTTITHKSDGSEVDEKDSTMKETTDQPEGIYISGDEWFAVGPGEHTKDSTDHTDDAMFPVDGCSNVQDAWNLRSHGEDLTISQSTLESRIERASEDQGCDLPDSATDGGCGCGCGGDCDTENDTNTNTMDFEFDDLSTEAALAKVSSQHDGVEERLSELEGAKETADEAEETMDELGVESLGDVADTVAMLREEKDSLEEKVDELQRPQMEDDAEFIADHTGRFGDDSEEVIEELDEEPEAVAEKRELVEELKEGYDETTANSGNSTPESESTGASGTYAKTPW